LLAGCQQPDDTLQTACTRWRCDMQNSERTHRRQWSKAQVFREANRSRALQGHGTHRAYTPGTKNHATLASGQWPRPHSLTVTLVLLLLPERRDRAIFRTPSLAATRNAEVCHPHDV